MATGYLRFPDVLKDEIVFVADDDLWLTDRQGRAPQRLTATHVPVKNPRFSPDGTMIAFTSTQDGPGDAYVLLRATGEIVRLTWWSHGSTLAVAWAADGRVLVASAWNSHYQRLQRIFAVDLEGGYEPMPYGIAGAVALGPRGAVATQSPNNRDSAMWKRYRGGTAAKLWLDPSGNGEWIRVQPDTEAGLYSPSFVGNRLTFTSDLGGDLPELKQAQLWSVDAKGNDLRQHTRHTMADGYVRDARSDGKTIVYHARGALYVMDGLDAKPRRLDIDVPVTPAPLTVDAKTIGAVAPDFGGDASVVEWRGAAFVLTHRAGPARALCDVAGVRTRCPAVLGQTGRAAYVTDIDGECAIEVVPLEGGTAQRVALGKVGYPRELVSNPAGTVVALATHDHRVLLVTVPGGRVTEVGRYNGGHPEGLTWSPDGRYLAFREPISMEESRSVISVHDTQDKKTFAVTDGRFHDFSPAFTLDGKYLTFLSARTFDPIFSAHGFVLAFGDSVKPYLVPLRADEESPFGPSVDGWRISEVLAARAADAGEAAPGADSEAAAERQAAVRCRIDEPGIVGRITPFPVPVGSYTELRAVKDGVVWMKQPPQQGVLGHSRAGVEGEPPKPALERWSFPARKVDVINQAATGYAVSGDGLRLVVRNDAELTVQPSDRKVEGDDQNRVTVDTSRLRRTVDRRAEWLQMFDEQGRLMRDLFWRADMDGVDWEGVLATYRPLVGQLATHDDLVDVLWETVAELNTGHAYVMPRPVAAKPTTAALLGADLTRLSSGEYRIDAIVATDTSNPEARSPLAAAGVAAKVGERIVAVDGHRLGEGWTLGEALQGSAGKPVELTLRAARGAAERTVAVVPLKAEYLLRYEAWVASRAEYVKQHSGGRIGYVHVPDMGPMGWAEFYRRLDEAVACDAVICDVRFNMGGNTSSMIVERLARKALGWGLARHFAPGDSYPLEARRGPILFVTNEFAGSDGDIVCANVQAQQLGTVIGERSWGGVIGIDGMYGLVDGTGVTQPRYSHWFEGYGWGVENHGIDPDIEVAMSPADWDVVAETDMQLDVAIAELERQLKERPAFQPVDLPEPRVKASGRRRGIKR